MSETNRRGFLRRVAGLVGAAVASQVPLPLAAARGVTAPVTWNLVAGAPEAVKITTVSNGIVYVATHAGVYQSRQLPDGTWVRKHLGWPAQSGEARDWEASWEVGL